MSKTKSKNSSLLISLLLLMVCSPLVVLLMSFYSSYIRQYCAVFMLIPVLVFKGLFILVCVTSTSRRKKKTRQTD